MTMDAYGNKIGWTYFFRPVVGGAIKIGWSHWPAERMLSYACWSPFPLEMMGSVCGPHSEEQFLHDCFFEIHSHCEWFRETPFLVEIIQKILAAGTVDAVHGLISPQGSVRGKVRGPFYKRRKQTTAARKAALAQSGIPA